MMNTALASVLPPMLRMVRRAVLRTDPARHRRVASIYLWPALKFVDFFVDYRIFPLWDWAVDHTPFWVCR